jgi:hypothetical protein
MLTIILIIYSPKCREVCPSKFVTLTLAPFDNKNSTTSFLPAEEAVNEKKLILMVTKYSFIYSPKCKGVLP